MQAAITGGITLPLREAAHTRNGARACCRRPQTALLRCSALGAGSWGRHCHMKMTWMSHTMVSLDVGRPRSAYWVLLTVPRCWLKLEMACTLRRLTAAVT